MYPIGPNESVRLAALEKLAILDAPPDPAYDRICQLAGDIFNVPVAIVSMVGQDEQVFRGCLGFDAKGTPRSEAFCNYTILSDDILVVEDATRDERFAANPLVVGPPGIRFYAGAPLALDPDLRLGTLCLIDFQPRSFSDDEVRRLRELAAIVRSQLELHRSRKESDAHRDALRASEARLRLAVETTGLGSWEYHAARGELRLSPECVSILQPQGQSQDDLRAFLDCVRPRDRMGLKRQLSRFKTGKVRSLVRDVRIIGGRDREERWIAVRGRDTETEEGRIVVGTIHDVTDLRVRAQQQQGLALLGQLALSEVSLEDLIQACADLVVRTLNVEHATVALAEEPGAQRLVLACGAGPTFDPAKLGSIDMNHSLLRRAFQAPGPLALADLGRELPGWRREVGGVLGISSGMAVGIGEHSRRYGAIGCGSAVERRFTQTETSFLESVAFVLAAVLHRREVVTQLRQRDRALEAVEQGIVICNAREPSWPLIYVNPAVERETGLTLEALNELGCSILLDAEPGDLKDRIRQDIAERGHFSGRVNCLHRDGRRSQKNLSVSCVRDEEGAVTQYVAMHTDLTVLLRLEGEVRQAQKMEAIGKLTGGVAHDINNLLTVILGNAELISEMSVQPKMRALADTVVQAAERGADTVQQLLAYGRRQDLVPEDLNVNEVLQSVTNLLKSSIGEEIFLRTRLSDDELGSRIDKSQFETAILNLVVNARDAMDRGGVVTIQTRACDLKGKDVPAGLAPGSYVSVSVSDTGCGIAPDALERVFEPFFTTKEVGKGTGLGLSMVYGFAQQSGGHARVASEVGKGTTVELLLPRIAAAHQVAAGTPTSAPARGRERILLVEDQDDVRNFVTAQLTSLGYDVSSVPDGMSALERIAEGPDVELLFTDIVMPGGLDGVQLAQRATRLKPNLRVLFTSGYSDLAIERNARFLDADTPLLKKPYRRSELSEALRAALTPSEPTLRN